MQKHSYLKMIAVLLVICLCVTSLPMSARAAEEESTQTEPAYDLRDAVAGIIDPAELYDPLDPATVPEIVGYENALSKLHVQRLYADEENDLNKLVFLNADGSKTMYTYDFPVKYIDESGAIQDISLEIADSSTASAGYETAAGSAVTTFSAQVTDGISLSGNDTQITLVPILPQVPPVGTAMFTAVAAADTGLTHTAQRIDEKTIEYRYDSNTTIEYSLTYTGFKEDIVVSEYTGQTEYAFRLYTNGCALTEIDGSYYLTDGAGTVRATIGDIIIFTADERNNTFGELVPTTIVENEEYLLTIVVDADFLADENTAYPIRIDPTVEINYDANGTGAIEDINVFSEATGKGTSGSLYIGLKEGSGVARALMKFPGLDLDAMGSNVTVQSAALELRDLMCESTAMDIYCYVFAGNTWTESTATWTNTNAGSNSSISTHLCTVTMDYDIGCDFTAKHRYSFDITKAVQGWLDGNYNPDKGIMLKMSATHESGSTYTYRTVASYNRSSNKPTLAVTYRINGGAVEVNEGKTATLSASEISGTITWTSSNTAVATVSSAGVVTGVRAGTATISASVGGVVQKTFTVRVLLANGVYYIKNLNSNYYLTVDSGYIENYTDVHQYIKYSTTTSEVYRIRQMWKVYYLGDGRYSVRPMNKLDMGLDVTGNNVDIYNIGTSDTLSGVPSYGEWTIEWYSTGYVFKNNGNSSYTMQVEGAATGTGATIIASTYSTSLNCRWGLTSMTEALVGVYLYDTVNKHVVSSPTKYVAPQEIRTLSNMSLVCVPYSPWVINQSVSWEVSSIEGYKDSVEVNSAGTVTGITPSDGNTITITARKVTNGYNRTVSYKLIVTELSNGTYYLKNKGTERYVDIENQTMAQGTKIHQWSYHGGNSQKWTFTHLGDGTYSIKSANSTSSYYLGVSGDSENADVAIVLRTGTQTNGMKWLIEKSSSHAYVLTPKTGEANNRVLSVGWYATSIDGIDIEQRDYSNNGFYDDEWHICAPIDIGLSTDNFTAGCPHSDLGSYHYANTFYNKLLSSPGGGPIAKIHHYNMDSTRSASKNDFSVHGAISNDIDFMIYIGHGHAAHDSKGNHLHYDCGILGTPHVYDNANEVYTYCNAAGNAYTSEMSFGSSTSDLRWVWLYTCNFLTTNSYVTEASLREMMNGAHIVMGYASRSTLCDAMAETFAKYLRNGVPIYDAYFRAGHDGEASIETAVHYQRVLYIPQARYETIYSPRIYYEYDASDVIMYTRSIHDEYS